ncbi:MAG: helix-turn-helix domain-containing protein [Saprospiraceae bacterium]
MNTLGDHLRKVRLDRGLSQLDVSVILKVSTDMVTCWELNRNQPTAKFAKAIIDFLGYVPFKVEDCSIGKQLFYARLISGKTQKQVAKIIGCDASNLRYIELDQRKPQNEIQKKIQEYIKTTLNYL